MCPAPFPARGDRWTGPSIELAGVGMDHGMERVGSSGDGAMGETGLASPPGCIWPRSRPPTFWIRASECRIFRTTCRIIHPPSRAALRQGLPSLSTPRPGPHCLLAPRALSPAHGATLAALSDTTHSLTLSLSARVCLVGRDMPASAHLVPLLLRRRPVLATARSSPFSSSRALLLHPTARAMSAKLQPAARVAGSRQDVW